MKTQYYTASSLDGFIADPNHSLDWLFQFGEPEDTDYLDFVREVGALAMGSTTYEWILAHHIRPDADRPQRALQPGTSPQRRPTGRPLRLRPPRQQQIDARGAAAGRPF